MKGGAETFYQSTATTGTHRFDSSRQFESKKWPELMSETRNLQTYGDPDSQDGVIPCPSWWENVATHLCARIVIK